MFTPLHEYRRLASFSPKELAYFVEGKELIDFKESIYRTLEQDPLFHKPVDGLSTTDHQILALRQYKRFNEFQFDKQIPSVYTSNLPNAIDEVIVTLDISMAAIKGLNEQLFPIVLTSFSQDEELIQLANKTRNLEVVGSFALTELSHGSDVQSIRTTATFDPVSQEFVVHTLT